MIEEAASGLGRSVDWRIATESALQQASLGTTPHVVIIYITDRLSPAAEPIRALVRRRTGATILSGTIGVGVCGIGDEAMDEPAVSVLALRFSDPGLVRELIWQKEDEPGHPSFGDDEMIDGVVALMHLHSSVVPAVLRADRFGSTWLCGGMTSSRGPQAQISTQTVYEGVGTGVLFSRSVPVQVGLSQGCVPLAPLRRVTGVMGPVVLTLDNRPALEVLLEDTASLGIDDPRELGRRVSIGVTLPHRDTHDFVVRNLTGIGESDRAIAVGHQCRLGDTLQFVTRDAVSARKDMVRMLEELAARMPAPKAGVYVSCVARGAGLFGEPDVEPSLIREVFGDMPLVGFYSGGEIYHRELYGYTGVLTLLGG